MGSGAVDPAGFRLAQHENWDAAAAGWMEWSDFNDRADRQISERLVELAGVGREAGSWTSPPTTESRPTTNVGRVPPRVNRSVATRYGDAGE